MVLHPWPYSNITSLVDWSVYANDLTGGYLGLLILASYFILSFAITSVYGLRRGYLVSVFSSFVIATLLMLIGILEYQWIILVLGGLIIGLAYFMVKGRTTI